MTAQPHDTLAPAPTLLNVGCGNDLLPGAINLDCRLRPGVDVVHDLRVTPWPFEDNSIDEIRAIDVLEHLDDFIGFFEESWRILKPGGKIVVQVPHYRSETTYIDPTHRRGYHLDSFDYLDPRTGWGAKYGAIYTSRYWMLLEKEYIEEMGNIRVTLRPDKA